MDQHLAGHMVSVQSTSAAAGVVTLTSNLCKTPKEKFQFAPSVERH